MSALITWTELPDKYGETMTERRGTFADLVTRLRTVGTFPNKDSCPWVKLATFGSKRSAKNSLRTNENLIAVYGIELDYDGETVLIEDARDKLEQHGIKAALYPSPSSTAEKPRWRVLCPLAEQHLPSARAALVARVNGVLGGVAASESFVLSQGFFFGATPTNNYRVLVTFEGGEEVGACVDELHELDQIAIGKKQDSKPDAPTQPDAPVSLNIFDDAVARVGRKLMSGDGRRELLKTYIASRSAKRLPADELRLLVSGVAAQYFDPDDPIDESNINQIIEHFAAKDAADDFEDLVAKAKAKKAPRYKLMTGTDLDALPAIPWRIKGVMPALGIAAMYGPSKSGKSFLSFDAGCAIAEGAQWFDYRTEAADVVLVALEGESGYKLRAQAWAKHHARVLPDRLRLVMQPFRLTEAKDIADLAAVVPPGAVVFVDTMNRAAPTADENSSKDMGQIIEGAKNLQRLTAGLVVLVAHTGKDASKGLRGHSSLLAALDGSIEVSREGDRRKWCVDKAKDGIDGSEHAFRLEVLELGRDEHDEPLTSCAVVTDGLDTSQSYIKPMTARQSEAMQAFRRAAPVSGFLDADDKFSGLHRDAWREAFYESCAADSQSAKQKAFVRAIQDLTNMGQVRVKDDVFMLDGITSGLEHREFASALKSKQTDPDNRTDPGHVPDKSG